MKNFLKLSFIVLIGLMAGVYCLADSTTTTTTITKIPDFSEKQILNKLNPLKNLLNSEAETFNSDNFESYTVGDNLNLKTTAYGTYTCHDGSECPIINNSSNCGGEQCQIHSGNQAVELNNWVSSNGAWIAFTRNETTPNAHSIFWIYRQAGTKQRIYLAGTEGWLMDIAFGDLWDCPANQACYDTTGGGDMASFGNLNDGWNKLEIWADSENSLLSLTINDDNENAVYINYNGMPWSLIRIWGTPYQATEYIDDISGESAPAGATINLTKPPSGSATSSTFDLSGTYSLNGENWPAILIYAQSWGISDTETSTCPQTDAEWQTEYNAGHYRGLGFAQRIDNLSTSSTPFTLHIENVAEGRYNCFYCEFFNSTSTSDNKCNGYWLDLVYLSPNQPQPFTNFLDYCSQKNFPCSSTIIISSAGIFESLFKMTTGWFSSFQNLFNINDVSALGATMGSAIPQWRSMINSFNGVLGGNFPLAQLLVFILIFQVAIVVYKLTVKIIGLVRGGG